MKKIFKRILAFVLPVIILIPCVVVFSEDTLPTTLYVGSTVVIENSNVTGNTSGSGWSYDQVTNTLNLNGANIEGINYGGNTGYVGIYADGDLNIKFDGENYVKSPASSNGMSNNGIWTKGKLTITGSDTGTLNVEVANSSNGVYISGISTDGGFDFKSGTITVITGTNNENSTGISTGGNSSISGDVVLNVTSGNVTGYRENSVGISAANLEISGDAKVTVTAGTSDEGSVYGVNASGNLVVSGNAYIYAKASDVINYSDGSSYGIYAQNFTLSGNAKVIGETTATSPWRKVGIGIRGTVLAEDGYWWLKEKEGDVYTSKVTPYTYDSMSSSTFRTYVEFRGHSHNYNGTKFSYDSGEHWELCATVDCPNPDTGVSTTKEAHIHDIDTGICKCKHSIPFTIATQPDNLNVEYTYKTEPKLSVKVNTFGSENVSYQWYEGNDTKTGTLLAGATQSTYNVPTDKTNGEYSYYCVVTSDSHTETSSIATLTVNSKDISNGTIEIIGEYSYIRGSMLEPKYKITVDGIDVTSYTNDYEIRYTNPSGTATLTLKDAGTYKVILTGKNGFTGSLETTLVVAKAIPDLGTISYSGTVTDKTKPADVTLTRSNTGVPGELRILDNKLLANKTTYRWEFAPDDEYNYEVLTGTIEIDVLDTTLPTAEIEVADKTWSTFDNDAINYDIFETEPIAVDITAKDDETGSGIKTVEYYLSKGQVYESENVLPTDGWVTLEEQDGKYIFDITESMNVHVYVRVTDNDGNITVINTSGIVKYEDITETTESIKYTKTSTKDVSVEMNLNGNTVNSIKYGETVLVKGQDYEILVSDNGIQKGVLFKTDYLDKFAAGEYEFVISYNPQGVETDKVTLNTTTVNLTVEKAMPKYEIPANLEGTYGNKLESINLPSGFTWNDKETVLSSAGENVFKATYTPEDTDSYEVVSDIEIYVNVLPKSITGAKVTLGDTLIYNGEEQTQTIKNVVLDGEEVTYKVTGNKVTKVGNYELTIEGTENFSGTIKVSYKVLPNTSILDNLDEGNVTIKDKEEIEDLKESIENSKLSEEEKKEWQDVIDECDDLLEKIEKLEKIEEEMKEIDKTLDSKEDVTIKDKEEIQDTIDKIDELLKDEDVTDEQKKELEEEKEKAEELLDKIDELEKAEEQKQEENNKEENNNNKNDNKEEVNDNKNDNKEENSNNKNENNKQDENNKNDNSNSSKPGNSNYNGSINQDKEDIKDSIKDIEEELGDLTEETVKSDDKEVVKDIINKIDELLKNEELTKNEKKELEQRLEKAESLYNEIIKLEIEEITELINEIPDNVTEEDISVVMAAYNAYNSLSEDEKALIDSDVKTKLEEAKETIDGFDNSSNDNTLENESSNNVFYWIISGIVGTVIIISTFIVRRNRRLEI